MKLYVSITTLPSRVAELKPTLDSLLTQSKVPDAIFLCLPLVSRREKVGYTIPEWLEGYDERVRILSVELDCGPGTKILGSFARCEDESVLVILDDDRVYGPDFLSVIYEQQSQNLDCSFSGHVYSFAGYGIGQGADGFSFYVKNLKGLKVFSEMALENRHLFLVDDLWLSAYLHTQGVKVCRLEGLAEDCFESSHSVNQLHHLDQDSERWAAMTEGLNYMKRKGMLGRGVQYSFLVKSFLRRLFGISRK